MNPSQAKKQQHARYDNDAVEVFNGKRGYIPAIKSKLSKSAPDKFNHKIEFA